MYKRQVCSIFRTNSTGFNPSIPEGGEFGYYRLSVILDFGILRFFSRSLLLFSFRLDVYKRQVVTLVLAVFANVVTYAQDNVVDEVVWVVGDEAILKSDVEEARMDARCV